MEAKKPSDRLAELDITLGEPVNPPGSMVQAIVVGDQIWVSGQVARRDDGDWIARGKVGPAVSMELAQQAARQCAINLIAAAASVVGGVDNILGVVRLGVFVLSEPRFTDQPKVANGASDLMGQVFGDDGKHVRTAVSSPDLPFGTTVEVDGVFQVRPSE